MEEQSSGKREEGRVWRMVKIMPLLHSVESKRIARMQETEKERTAGDCGCLPGQAMSNTASRLEYISFRSEHAGR